MAEQAGERLAEWRMGAGLWDDVQWVDSAVAGGAAGLPDCGADVDGGVGGASGVEAKARRDTPNGRESEPR